jgi:hypothetical protein
MLLVAGLRLLQGWIERRFGQRAADAGVGA